MVVVVGGSVGFGQPHGRHCPPTGAQCTTLQLRGAARPKHQNPAPHCYRKAAIQGRDRPPNPAGLLSAPPWGHAPPCACHRLAVPCLPIPHHCTTATTHLGNTLHLAACHRHPVTLQPHQPPHQPPPRLFRRPAVPAKEVAVSAQADRWGDGCMELFRHQPLEWVAAGHSCICTACVPPSIPASLEHHQLSPLKFEEAEGGLVD